MSTWTVFGDSRGECPTREPTTVSEEDTTGPRVDDLSTPPPPRGGTGVYSTTTRATRRHTTRWDSTVSPRRSRRPRLVQETGVQTTDCHETGRLDGVEGRPFERNRIASVPRGVGGVQRLGRS